MGFRFPEAFIALLILAPLLWQAWRGQMRDRAVAAAFKSQPPGRIQAAGHLGCLAFFIAALVAVGARPYFVPAMTGNYLFVSDVSRSMEARQSCREPTLMQRSRQVMRQVVAGMPDAKFGIMAFERLAFPVTQMTYDHTYLSEVIEHGLFVGLIYERTATQFANVLTAVAQKKEKLPQIYGGVDYAIFVTDGNVNASEEGRFREAVARLNQAGIHLLIVGVGSAGGLPIPDVENGRCFDDTIKVDGKEVRIALRADILRTVANDTQGRYFGEGETGELVKFMREHTLHKAPAHTVFSAAQQRDAGWIFLALATVALFAMILLGMNVSFDARRGFGAMWDRIKRRAISRLIVPALLTLLASCAVAPSMAFAHIARAEVQFTDISSLEARFDIGLLTALGIIPKASTFEPGKPLARKDLAVWIALANAKAEHDKKLDLDALAKSALAAGRVGSLDGTATFGDLARAFFKDAVMPDRGSETPTRAEAARFLAAHADALLTAMGFKMGPVGMIGKVEQKKTEAGGATFFITIGQTTLPMYAHGSIGAGPTDLSRWADKAVRRSVIRTENGRDMWTYLEAAEPF